VKKAYGFDQISFNGVKGDGSGQTIAIVGAFDAPTIASDLKAFDKQFSLADPPSFRKVSQTGSTSSLPAADADWALELSLDVEWAHAVAPKANLLLVEARSDSLGDLLSAGPTTRAMPPACPVVSMSWGAGTSSGARRATTTISPRPAGHQGVTFVAASGDDGSSFGPMWPSVAGSVLSVGGTALSLSRLVGTVRLGARLVGQRRRGELVRGTSRAIQANVQSDRRPRQPRRLIRRRSQFRVRRLRLDDARRHSGWWIRRRDQRRHAAVGGADRHRRPGPQARRQVVAQRRDADAADAVFAGEQRVDYSADFHDIASGRTSWFVSAAAGTTWSAASARPRRTASCRR
jgi:hypothetical protein